MKRVLVNHMTWLIIILWIPFLPLWGKTPTCYCNWHHPLMTDSVCVRMKSATSWPNHKLSIETHKGTGSPRTTVWPCLFLQGKALKNSNLHLATSFWIMKNGWDINRSWMIFKSCIVVFLHVTYLELRVFFSLLTNNTFLIKHWFPCRSLVSWTFKNFLKSSYFGNANLLVWTLNLS